MSSLFFSGNLISFLDPGLFALIGNTLTALDVSYNYLDRNNLASTETDIMDVLQPDWESTQYGADTTPPSLSDIHIESSNANDISIAVLGDQILLSFYSDEELDINNLFVTIAGESVMAEQGNCGGGIFCYTAPLLTNELTQQ